jgi:regulator of replication initiation timing
LFASGQFDHSHSARKTLTKPRSRGANLFKRQLEDAHITTAGLRAAAERAEARLASLSAERDQALLEAEQLRDDAIDALEENATLVAASDGLRADNEALRASFANLAAERDQALLEAEQLRDDAIEVLKENAALVAANDSLRADNDDLRASLANLVAEYYELEAELRDLLDDAIPAHAGNITSDAEVAQIHADIVHSAPQAVTSTTATHVAAAFEVCTATHRPSTPLLMTCGSLSSTTLPSSTRRSPPDSSRRLRPMTPTSPWTTTQTLPTLLRRPPSTLFSRTSPSPLLGLTLSSRPTSPRPR